MSERNIDDILNDVIQSKIAKIHTAIPGKFESFDGKVASVKPLIQKKYTDGDIQPLPIITGVPVIFPSSSDFQFTFPIKKGDGCLIVFSERAISNWISKGGDQIPDTPRKYDITDAIAIPGLFSPAISEVAYDENDVVLKYNGATIRVQKDEKFAIGNPNAELLDIISQLLGILSTDGTAVGGGLLLGNTQYLDLQLTIDTFLKGEI